MRVTQTYHLETQADQLLKQQLETAIAALFSNTALVPVHSDLPAWIGLFKRTGTIEGDCLEALYSWLRQAERVALTGAGGVAENGGLWSAVQMLEDAIYTLHWKAGLFRSGAGRPLYPRPETEKDGWIFLGPTPPLPRLQTASDQWMDAWGQRNVEGVTVVLRFGPGINHAMQRTCSEAQWRTISISAAREDRKWQPAIDLALAKKLIRVAPTDDCAMVA